MVIALENALDSWVVGSCIVGLSSRFWIDSSNGAFVRLCRTTKVQNYNRLAVNENPCLSLNAWHDASMVKVLCDVTGQ